jgi:hypothetical protein
MSQETREKEKFRELELDKLEFTGKMQVEDTMH